MATQSFKIDVTVAPVTDGPAPAKIDGGFTSSSLRKSYDDEQQVITCVAMAANEIDAHGDLFLPSAVQMAAHGFLANYNLGKFIGKQHDPDAAVDADLIGSFYTEKALTFEGLDVPDHSWVAQLRINDAGTWAEVKKSDATGLSIQGPASGWIVDDDVEKALSVQLSKAKAGESEYTKPKRVFSEADPTNLDIVDAGANLHLLVWKASIKMADKSTETIITPVVKGQAVKPAEVAAPEPTITEPATAVAPPVAPDVIGELAKGLATVKALQGMDVELAIQQLAQLTKVLGGTGNTPAPATDAPKVEPAAGSDIEAIVAKQLAPVVEENKQLKVKIEELEKAKVAPTSVVDGDDGASVVLSTAVEVHKAKFPGNVIDLDGSFATTIATGTVANQG